MESVASDIGKLGTAVAVITFVALMINYIIDCSKEQGECEEGWEWGSSLQFIVQAFMIGITIIVVAVPEVSKLTIIK